MKPLVLIADSQALEESDLFEKLYEAAPAYRKEKVDRFHFDSDKRLSLAAGTLLGIALRECGCDEAELTLCEGEYGKPYFKELPALRFNLSHSGNRALCAVAESDIGCDVELVKEYKEVIAKRFFHPSEIEHLADTPPNRIAREFYRLWTLKESYLKCTGIGLNVQLDSFGILFDGEGRPYLPNGGYFFHEYSPRDGYRYSICVAGDPEEPEFRLMDLKKQGL